MSAIYLVKVATEAGFVITKNKVLIIQQFWFYLYKYV